MSTRCNVIVGERVFYHHYDGYFEGVGTDLAYFVANTNAIGILKTIDQLADNLKYGIYGRLGKDYGHDRTYEECNSDRINDDIEFLYLIEGTTGDFRLYGVDICVFIKGHPSGGWPWEHPIFSMHARELRDIFCCPEYLLPLPSTEVPREKRMYAATHPLTYDQARYCGMTEENLKWGNTDYESGFVRVRNVKRPRWWRK